MCTKNYDQMMCRMMCGVRTDGWTEKVKYRGGCARSKNNTVYIHNKGFSIPYRKLARVGFEPTTLCLLCTHCNHWTFWPNDEICLMVYRIKWPRSPSSSLGDCSGWVQITFAGNFLYFFYFHPWPCSELILG